MQMMQICNVSAQIFLEKIHSMGEEHFEKNITQSVFFWADRETLRNNRYLREKKESNLHTIWKRHFGFSEDTTSDESGTDLFWIMHPTN